MKAQKQQKYSPPRLLEIFKSPFKNPQKNTKLWVHFQTLEQDSRNVGFKPDKDIFRPTKLMTLTLP